MNTLSSHNTSQATSINETYDRIAIWYNLVHHLVTFGLDNYWRKSASELLHNRGPLRVLDLACGSGELINSLIATKLTLSSINGIDISENMIAIAKQKLAKKRLNNAIFLEKGDMRFLRFENGLFDAVTISFGLQNAEDSEKILKEASRVLKPDCPLIVLEFIKPKSRFFKFVYTLYIRYIMPCIGGLISGATGPYRKIARTISQSVEPRHFELLLKSSGFQKTTSLRLFPGIAIIYTGKKTTAF